MAVESRLVALGRAHDLLLQAHWASAKLADVIRSAIQPFDSQDVRRFVVQDTDIEIGPGAVLPLTMSLNELCTNAVKYGALSNAKGRIEISSTVDEKDSRFKLTWTEKGGPAVQEPVRRSFGTRLINRLAEQLHGDARLRYEPAGVVYELDVPLSTLRGIPRQLRQAGPSSLRSPHRLAGEPGLESRCIVTRREFGGHNSSKYFEY